MIIDEDSFSHYGVPGMKWGVRRRLKSSVGKASRRVQKATKQTVKFASSLNKKFNSIDPVKVKKAAKFTARVLSAGLILHTIATYTHSPNTSSYEAQYARWLRTAG